MYIARRAWESTVDKDVLLDDPSPEGLRGGDEEEEDGGS